MQDIDGYPRNNAVSALKANNLAQWKLNAGYHFRSLSETVMSKYKGLTNTTLIVVTTVKVVNT